MTEVFRWEGATPDGTTVAAAFTTAGTWNVVYGGFSRSTSRQLLSALAEASAAARSASWVVRLEAQIASAYATAKAAPETDHIAVPSKGHKKQPGFQPASL